jgi:hypothetical protein
MLKRRIKRPAKGSRISPDNGKYAADPITAATYGSLLSINAQLDKFSVYYSIDLETFAESVVQIR